MNKYRLAELVKPNRPITYGIVQPGPDVHPNGIPLIRGKDYSSGRVATEGLYHVLPEIDKPYTRSKVEAGDVLLSIAGYVGQIAIVPDQLTGANITQTTARLSCSDDKVNSKYLFYALQSETFHRTQVKKYEKGSAQSGLNLSDVGNFIVEIPPLPQQRKIARILSTCDKVIEQTEAAIAKYQAIKQGMMHDLFTRGIDVETGKLRPTYQDAPELYKESDLGMIPKGWEEELLEKHIKVIDSGWSPVCLVEPANTDEWGSLKTTSVTWEGYNPSENKKLPKHLSPKLETEVYLDDILITRVGPRDRVGVVVHVNNPRKKLMVSDNMLRIRTTKNNTLFLPFLELILGSKYVQKEWKRKIAGLAEAQVVINQQVIKSTIFPLAPFDEQKVIHVKIMVSRNRIKTEQSALAKYMQIKAGLMQDLLTGKVEVKVDEIEHKE